MNSVVSPFSWSKLAAVGLIASAFALGGCGRKGPLDLPPNTATAPATTEGTSQPYRTQAAPGAADETLFAPSGSGSNRQMVAPRGEKKRIFLDPLLD